MHVQCPSLLLTSSEGRKQEHREAQQVQAKDEDRRRRRARGSGVGVGDVVGGSRWSVMWSR